MKTSHFLFSILLASIFTISCSSSKKATSATEKGTEVKELETTPKESTTKIDDREDKLKKTIASYPDSLVVLLKRTPCYGKCPIYILKIYASGYATYEGKNFVEMEGNYAGKMGKESIAALLKKVDEINFFELKISRNSTGSVDRFNRRIFKRRLISGRIMINEITNK